MVVLLSLLALGLPSAVYSLSCTPCGFEPCQEPVCCSSGFYTPDACGCCLQCAKPESEECGGPFGTSGSCSQGLRCLRSCECKSNKGNKCVFPFSYQGKSYTECTTDSSETGNPMCAVEVDDMGNVVESKLEDCSSTCIPDTVSECTSQTGKKCIFPFSYQGKTYSECTVDHSENGKAWCAVEVEEKREVLANKWEDCAPSCFGACNDAFLFNVEGKCVNGTEAPELLRSLQNGKIAAELDEDFSSEQFSAPVCISARTPSDSPDFCRCTRGSVDKDHKGNPKGGCNIPFGVENFPGLEDGYCFLENIQDFSNPKASCYADTQWSAADGRFYSHTACQIEKSKKN